MATVYTVRTWTYPSLGTAIAVYEEPGSDVGVARRDFD